MLMRCGTMAQASACAWPRHKPSARAASLTASSTSPCVPFSTRAKGASSGGLGCEASVLPGPGLIQTVTGQFGSHAETTRFIVLLQGPGAGRAVAATDELGDHAHASRRAFVVRMRRRASASDSPAAPRSAQVAARFSAQDQARGGARSRGEIEPARGDERRSLDGRDPAGDGARLKRFLERPERLGLPLGLHPDRSWGSYAPSLQPAREGPTAFVQPERCRDENERTGVIALDQAGQGKPKRRSSVRWLGRSHFLERLGSPWEDRRINGSRTFQQRQGCARALHLFLLCSPMPAGVNRLSPASFPPDGGLARLLAPPFFGRSKRT